MFGSSHYQNNQLASQTVSLPASYFNYLSSKHFNLNSDLADNHPIIGNQFRLFPGIKIIEAPDQENVKVSINKRTLPLGYKSLRSQTLILNALQALESISKIPADATEPESQKQMASDIHNALKKCFVLEEMNEDPMPGTNLIVFLSILAVYSLIVALVVTAASVFLFLPMAMPVMLAAALTAIVLGGLMGTAWGCFTGSAAGLMSSLSTVRQAKAACENLSEVVKRVDAKTSYLMEEQSSSTTATAPITAAAPTRRSGSPVFLPPVAPANSPQIEQEDTATTVYKPHS